MTRTLSRGVLLALLCVAAVSRTQAIPSVFINEIHYDNASVDTGEFIEIAGPAGTDLSTYSIVLYNGNGGAAYDTDPLSGTIPNQQNGFGTVSLAYPTDGIQNGSPDGVALVQGTTVIQFLSYEGTFTATSGPANGMVSQDIGVSEPSTTPAGQSLQLVGTGSTYTDFAWSAPAVSSPGLVNTGQTFTGTAGASISIDDVSVTEGDAGTTSATFTVTVNGSHSGVSFDIATADGVGGNAATAADGDYTPRSETGQSIPPGSATATFTVAVNGDLKFETDEQFVVALSNATGATIADATGLATITNDDAAPPVTSDVVISQVYGGGGNSGATFTHDFIELFNRGTSTISLAGWSVQYLAANGSGTWAVTPLAGSIAPGTYYLIREAQGTGGTTPLPAPDAIGSIAMGSGAGKVALQDSATAIVGACPSGPTADLVGYGGSGNVNCFEGVGPVSALTNTTAALRKRGGCFDSNNNNVDFTAGSPTPRNSASPIRACTFVPAEIHEIQGTGATTPYLGIDVTTSGIVTAKKSNGFFLQTASDGDNDPLTSQALFVFTSSTPAVSPGDAVIARGTATEFFNLTQVEATLPGDVSVQSSGNPVPAALTVTTVMLDPDGPADQLEPFEGMRVHADTLISVAPTNGFGETFTVLPGVARPMREPGIEISAPVPPDPTTGIPDCCIPRFDENPERIMVDSDGLAGAAVISVTSGVTFSNVTGPLDFSFGDYKVLPETAPGVSGNISAIPVPAPTADEFTVAGYNIENFQNDATQRQKAALAIRQVLHYPDVIGHIEIFDLASLQALAAQVNADAALAGDPDPAYQAYLIPVGSGTQNVGFLVKTSRVQVDEVRAEGVNDTYINPITGLPETLHDRPPLVLEATVSLPGLSPRPVIIVVNHTRSFIDIELVGGDGVRVRAKRTAQAEAIARLLQDLQATNPATPVISIGDYNAYQFNDGYTDPVAIIKGDPTPDDQIVVDASPDFVNPDFVNLTDTLPASERYSFVFEGTPQAIDHVFVNSVAAALVTRYAIARNNADFPEGPLFAGDATRPERNSDHDMPMAYFVFPPSAELSLSATGPGGPVQTGTGLSYSVMVSNDGPDAATNVAVSIPSQSGLRFGGIQAPAGWSCTTPTPGAIGPVSCVASTLASSTSATFILTATLDCGVANAALVVQGMSASSDTSDPTPANNSTAITITADNPPPVITGVITPIVVSPVPGAPRAGAVVSNAMLGSPAVSDNCPGATVARSGVPAGNVFPVGSTSVTYTATDSGGNTATATQTVQVLSAIESLNTIAADLEVLILSNPPSAQKRRLEDALRGVRRGIAELGEAPPDDATAATAITAAIGDIDEAVRKGFNPSIARDLMKRLAGVSWLLARQDLEAAIARGGRPVNITLAAALIQQGNTLAANGQYGPASSAYLLAIGLALQA